ncbi:hypothetical protein [Streptomyces sp. NBC_00588]|uniref:hypothetical protein n=1 Tax=Streptomyces sp. NBC_00588 TaxID=2975784 RepID=UPI002E822319|nr:hypothetical protein [Streptomyces sp. NBC_00588]WUB35520.1 hypothetical protein OHN38_11565 [Streptomyces sp. NBC_00588]
MGTGPRGNDQTEEKVKDYVQNTSGEWDFVRSTSVNADPFWFADHGFENPCGEFRIMICGALRQRLRAAARRAGVTPETMVNAILAEALGGGRR